MYLNAKYLRSIGLSVLLILFAFCADAQIKGTVTDAVTHQPIASASVYLNGTYMGTITDSLGRFSLASDKTNIPLVISSVGYASQEINDYAGKDLAVSLKQKVDELKQVNVVVDEMSRAKKMKIFLTEFLGGMNSDCVLVNQDDVWLHYQKKNEELTAGSFNPLIILNKKLGYKLTYFMSNFRTVPLQTTYAGNYIFTEDTTGLKPSAIQKILKNRDEAYFGSRMHFVRSLWANNLANNNFNVNHPITKEPIRGMGQYGYQLIDSTRVFYKTLVTVKNNKIFHDQKFILIPQEYCITFQKSKNTVETSFVKFASDNPGTLIDADGNYGEGLEWKGEMGISRINKLLPLEFKPVAVLKKLAMYQPVSL